MAKINKRNSPLFIGLVLTPTIFFGCGVKGPPEPPYPTESMYRPSNKTLTPSSSLPPEQIIEPLAPAKVEPTPFSTKKIKTNKSTQKKTKQ